MLSKKIDLERNRPLSRKRQAFFPSVFFLELSNLMKGLHHLCWNSETSELLYNNGFKNTTETQFFCNPPIWGFFFCYSFCLCVCGLFCQHKGSYVIILNDSCQNPAVCRTGAREGQSTAQEERERLSEAFWSDTNVISWCHVLCTSLHVSPLENNKELFRYSGDVYKRHLAWMWELLCTL